MEKSLKRSDAEHEKYLSIIEYSPVSLWAEDISRLRAKLAEMRTVAGFSLRSHMNEHPEFVQEAFKLIQVIDVNQASLRLFEADRKEQLIGPLDRVLDDVSRGAAVETILAIDDGRTDIEVESSAVTLKGKKLALLAKSHIPPADAAYPSMLVSLIDITARKEAEERERRSASILHSIIDSSPDSIFVKDRSLRMVLCNTALAHAIGKEPEDTYGKTDVENGWSVDLVKGNPQKGIVGWEKDDLAVLSGVTVQVAAEPTDFDKGIRYFQTAKFPFRDRDGSVIGLIGIGRDVTERLQAETDLRHAKELAENLIDTARAIIVGLDGDGRVTIFNKAAEEITGYMRAEMVGRSWFETVVPKARYPQVWEKFERLTDKADVGSFENPILTKSGEERYVAWNNSQILEDGRVTGTLSYGLDVTDSRRIQQELAWERSLFSMLMENLPDYIYFKDTASRFIRTSRSHARALGLKDPAEAEGKTDADFYGADHALKALEDERRILSTGEPLLGIEERENYPDRPDTWAITSKMPLRNAAGVIVGTFGITHDITIRKRIEQELTWERFLFSTLMDNVPDYIYFKDLSSRFIRTTRSHANILGLTDPAEAVGKTDADFYGAESARKSLADEQRVLETGMPQMEIEEQETYPGRMDTWAITSKLPLRDAAGHLIGTFGITHDITKRKLLEVKNQQLATLVESADDAIVGLDLDRRITVWNSGAERLYGYTAAEMLGTATSVLIPAELEEEAKLMRERVTGEEQITHYETSRLKKDGSRIIVSLTLSGIRDEKGDIIGMASVARDVTEQKAIEAQLYRAQRLESLATLAAGVAHQFNNINTVVGGYLQMMQMEKKLPARMADYVAAARTGLQRAIDITDRLLALTVSAPGSADTVRLDELARAVAESHEQRIGAENVRLVMNLAETPPIRGDESRLRFVLSSLLGNALDALLDRPVRMVRIRTACAKDTAYFEIEDSGCGIPELDMPRIFSPFYSAKGEWAPTGSPQARLKGVGLSLAISSTTISEYGGRIDVQSTSGAGSTFRVVMPLSRPGS